MVDNLFQWLQFTSRRKKDNRESDLTSRLITINGINDASVLAISLFCTNCIWSDPTDIRYMIRRLGMHDLGKNGELKPRVGFLNQRFCNANISPTKSVECAMVKDCPLRRKRVNVIP